MSVSLYIDIYKCIIDYSSISLLGILSRVDKQFHILIKDILAIYKKDLDEYITSSLSIILTPHIISEDVSYRPKLYISTNDTVPLMINHLGLYKLIPSVFVENSASILIDIRLIDREAVYPDINCGKWSIFINLAYITIDRLTTWRFINEPEHEIHLDIGYYKDNIPILEKVKDPRFDQLRTILSKAWLHGYTVKHTNFYLSTRKDWFISPERIINRKVSLII